MPPGWPPFNLSKGKKRKRKMSQNLIKPRAHFHLQEKQGIAEQAKRQEEANGPEGRTVYSTTNLPSLTSQIERTFERTSRYIMTK